jgi:hypothetical protein
VKIDKNLTDDVLRRLMSSGDAQDDGGAPPDDAPEEQDQGGDDPVTVAAEELITAISSRSPAAVADALTTAVEAIMSRGASGSGEPGHAFGGRVGASRVPGVRFGGRR